MANVDSVEVQQKLLEIIQADVDLYDGGVFLFDKVLSFNPGKVEQSEGMVLAVSFAEWHETDGSTTANERQDRFAIRIYKYDDMADDAASAEIINGIIRASNRLGKVLMKRSNRSVDGFWWKSKWLDPAASIHRVERRRFMLHRFMCYIHTRG